MELLALYLISVPAALVVFSFIQGLTDGDDDVVGIAVCALFWPAVVSVVGAYLLGETIRKRARR